jgi:putative SOS response-associated peptidase YedK
VAEPTGFIMARAESVAKKPAFAAAFRERRCLFLADGFYEWARAGSRKLPYYIHRPSTEPFTIAGIWEPARDGQIDSCALITRPALSPVDALHDRMPAVIDAQDRARWLDPQEGNLELLGELLSAARPELSMFPVSPRVNATRIDDPSCILPRPDGPQPGDQMELFPAPRLRR